MHMDMMVVSWYDWLYMNIYTRHTEDVDARSSELGYELERKSRVHDQLEISVAQRARARVENAEQTRHPNQPVR